MADSLSPLTNAASTKAANQAHSVLAPNEGEAAATPFAGVLDEALTENGSEADPEAVAVPLLLSDPGLLDALNVENIELTGNDLPQGGTPIAWSMLTLVESPLPPQMVSGIAAESLADDLLEAPDLSAEYKQLSPYKPFFMDTAGINFNGAGNPLDNGKMAVQFEALMLEPVKATETTQLNTQLNPQTANLVSQGLVDTSVQATGKNDMPVLNMPVPPHNPAWATNLGERLQWIVGNKLQQAEIRLDPPELGALEIKIAVQKEHAQVNIVAHHAQVRDAVEAATPRLREMFSDIGLNLGDVNVSQESFGQQQMAGDESASGDSTEGTEPQGLTASEVDSANPGLVIRQGQGLLDTFA